MPPWPQDPSPEGLQQHLQTLRDSDLRFSLVADLEAFAASDGSATAEERQRIAQVAQMVGVNPQQHAALSQFVMKAQSASPEEIHQPGFLDRLGLGNILGGSGINTGSLMKGLLAVGGPLLLAKMLSGSRSGSAPRSGGLLGSLLGGAGLAAGASALGGMLGGGGGGGLGSLLGGGNSGGGLGSIFGGNSDDEGQYANQNIPQQSSGGLGSIFQTLTGGGQQGGGGGLGSLLGGLGGLFGGR